MPAFLGMARLRQLAGDWTGAHAQLDALAGLCDESNAPQVMPAIAAARARLWAEEGRLDRAAEWAAGTGLIGMPSIAFPQEPVASLVAQVLAILGRNAEAEAVLAPLLESARAGGRTGRLIEWSALQAVVLQRAGRGTEARVVLEDGTRAGRAGGLRPDLCRPGRDHGRPSARAGGHAAAGRQGRTARIHPEPSVGLLAELRARAGVCRPGIVTTCRRPARAAEQPGVSCARAAGAWPTPTRRSPASSWSLSTPSRPTCATSTRSSAPHTAPKPSPAPASCDCYRRLGEGAHTLAAARVLPASRNSLSALAPRALHLPTFLAAGRNLPTPLRPSQR